MLELNITRTLVAERERIEVTDALFGIMYPLKIEPAVYHIAGMMCPEQYHGGYWKFYTLSNGGFYMGLSSDELFHATSVNGNSATVTADTLGLVCSLTAFNWLAWSKDPEQAMACGQHFHLLRDYALSGDQELESILALID